MIEPPSTPARDVCTAWNPSLPGVTEVLHAEFFEHAYPTHCHDTWTLLLVDSGAVGFTLHRQRRAAPAGSITVLPPFVAHDGRSAEPGLPFRKRSMYMDLSAIDDRHIGAAVDRPSIDDPGLRALLSRLHGTLRRNDVDDLEPEGLLALVVERVRTHLRRGVSQPGEAPSAAAQRLRPDAADALRDVLDARTTERLKLDELGAELGWNTTHLIRSFTHKFGLPPHRYLISRRLDRARRLLLDGVAPAAVAADVGFHDQAHLGRHFKAHVGTTPRDFAAS